eukprot:scaffold3369_cov106-Isochrysis_galbana.AAC.1
MWRGRQPAAMASGDGKWRAEGRDRVDVDAEWRMRAERVVPRCLRPPQASAYLCADMQPTPTRERSKQSALPPGRGRWEGCRVRGNMRVGPRSMLYNERRRPNDQIKIRRVLAIATAPTLSLSFVCTPRTKQGYPPSPHLTKGLNSSSPIHYTTISPNTTSHNTQ